MLERDLIRALRLLAEPQIKPIAAAGDSLAAESQAPPGPRFRARVEAALPDGVYRVSVAGQSLNLTLSAAVRPGDTLELVRTGNPARPGFVPASSPAKTEEPARATLSETGRLLSALARQPSATPSLEATAVAGPLLPSPPAGAGDLAPRLRQALSQSGLFYESHQAEWVAGKRPLSDLLQEPQGRLSPSSAKHSAFEAHTGLPEAEISQTSSRRQESASPVVDEQAAPLVRQQLDTLDLRQIQWRGEIWPDQWMDWTIAEAPARDQDELAARQWQTHLRLTLPQMGEISATLTLALEGLTLDLEADPASAPILKSGGPLLWDALQAAGLPVLKWTVSDHARV